MDIDTVNTIYSGIRLVGGLFDFLVFVGLMIVALMFVRKADATAGYVLAGAASVQFLMTCCGNVVSGLGEQLGEASMIAGVAVSSINLFVDLAVSGAVLYVLYALAAKAPQQS